jgi:(S)-ureidoglycine aminohydrolase
VHNPDRSNLSLTNLGETRSSHKSNHLLLTPDTFVRTTLPGMKSCAAVVHAGTAMGAAFTQYTAEFEAGGELGNVSAQRFVYVIDGEVTVEVGGKRSAISARGYAYVPQGMRHRVTAANASRAAVNGLQRRCRLFACPRRRS